MNNVHFGIHMLKEHTRTRLIVLSCVSVKDRVANLDFRWVCRGVVFHLAESFFDLIDVLVLKSSKVQNRGHEGGTS